MLLYGIHRRKLQQREGGKRGEANKLMGIRKREGYCMVLQIHNQSCIEQMVLFHDQPVLI